jgi:prevent-host-death family protein
MKSKIQKMNAFDAKTRLSELLRETERGASYIILRRGKEVARLVPPVKENKKINRRELIASFHEIRQRITGRVNIRELVEEGRRF